MPQGTTASVMRRLFPEPPDFDPAAWIESHGGFLTYDQRGICDSIRDNPSTACRSCHDAGKSYTMSEVILAWADTYQHDGFVVWTAPTYPQVNAIIGRELKAGIKRHNLDLELTGALELRLADGTMVGFGRKPADHDAHGFQGIHAKHVLVVIDEGCGIPKTLFTAAMALATNRHARIAVIGNPDDPAAEFETFFSKPDSEWNLLHIDGLRTPNFTKEAVLEFPRLYDYFIEHKIPFSEEYVPEWLRPLLLSPHWAANALERWGADSALFQSKVRGEFSEVSNDTLYPPALIRECQELELPGSGAGQLAYDIARMGPDETVGYRNRGGVVRVAYSARKQDTMVTTGAIARELRDLDHRVPAWVDADGLGAGVFDRLVEQGLPVYAWHGGHAPMDRDRFTNRRAEAYWHARELMMEGQVDIDADDDVLEAQLRQLRFKIDSRGRIAIETKDEMRKRGLKSPDRADAFVMALWMAPRPATSKTNRDLSVSSITGDLLSREM